MIEARPLAAGEFCKYHALGNDYLVIDGSTFGAPITAASMAALCHRHTGVGSDGVLVLDAAPKGHHASLRIYNPDGSLAEKSGNGLRIFARALFDLGYVREAQVRVYLSGQTVHLWLQFAPAQGASPQEVALVRVNMGKPAFDSLEVGLSGPAHSTQVMALEVLGETLDVTAVSMGNPHCVHFVSHLDVARLRLLGPAIERHPLFTHHTNVQLARVVNRGRLDVLIWERGAHETAASGSSSCAAVAAAQARGLCDATVRVHSPGGSLLIERDENDALQLTGPATPVCRGVIF